MGNDGSAKDENASLRTGGCNAPHQPVLGAIVQVCGTLVGGVSALAVHATSPFRARSPKWAWKGFDLKEVAYDIRQQRLFPDSCSVAQSFCVQVVCSLFEAHPGQGCDQSLLILLGTNPYVAHLNNSCGFGVVWH